MLERMKDLILLVFAAVVPAGTPEPLRFGAEKLASVEQGQSTRSPQNPSCLGSGDQLINTAKGSMSSAAWLMQPIIWRTAIL